MRQMICNHSQSCRDPICIHADPHNHNWWCEQEQICTTHLGRASHDKRVQCQAHNSEKKEAD